MIIVKLQGRLGNQMFQYALAKNLQSIGKAVTIDSGMLPYDGNVNELGLFPNVREEMQEADRKLVENLGDCNKAFLCKVKRKTIGYKKTHIREIGYQFHPEIMDMDNVYLDGYWQTEKYFKSIEDQIRKLYTFPEITDEINKETVRQIQTCDSVSIHIRRGDYLNAQNAPMHGNICTKDYYDKAIAYMREQVENPRFFIFTDDTAWARQEYKNQDDFVIIDNNHGNQSFRDMQLMSLCKHNITANSSFSWWGAWLNQNPNKIVVTPPKWFNLAETPDIWCEEWKIMSD